MGNCLSSPSEPSPAQPQPLVPIQAPIPASNLSTESAAPAPAAAPAAAQHARRPRVPQYQGPPIPAAAAPAPTKQPVQTVAPPPPPRAIQAAPPNPTAAAAAGAPPPASTAQAFALFFPDPALPCRFFLQGKPCGKKRACNFSHTPTSLTRFLDILTSAQRTLDICVFTITCDEIADRVLEIHNRGVRVRVITDNDQINNPGSDINRFAEARIAVRTDRTSALMHHKFAIVDGAVLLSGSYNWSRQATIANNENIVVYREPALLAAFQQEFEKLWATFVSVNARETLT
eukprot:m.37925 g.37925  ORF g.37925 m.37925 type:complete len:288 (-) comp9896_c0_seq1:25-888(-)